MKAQESAKDTYLAFKLGGECFALSVIYVLEVMQRQKITPVPNAPQNVTGVFNFRGEIIPVIETRRKFGLPPSNAFEKQAIIVLEVQSANNNNVIIGAIVDSVKDVVNIKNQEIKSLNDTNKTGKDYLNGFVKIGNDYTLLLNVEKVFTEEIMD